MTWIAPPTFVNGALTAAQLNILSGDLLETAPAKATTAGQYFVSSGANVIVARVPISTAVDTAQGTGSATPTDLITPGPAVTTTTGARSLVFIASNASNDTANQYAYMSYAVTGASTISASDNRSVSVRSATANTGNRATAVYLEQSLTPGSNTFTTKYWAPGSGTANFSFRSIIVCPL